MGNIADVNKKVRSTTEDEEAIFVEAEEIKRGGAISVTIGQIGTGKTEPCPDSSRILKISYSEIGTKKLFQELSY